MFLSFLLFFCVFLVFISNSFGELKDQYVCSLFLLFGRILCCFFSQRVKVLREKYQSILGDVGLISLFIALLGKIKEKLELIEVSPTYKLVFLSFVLSIHEGKYM